MTNKKDNSNCKKTGLVNSYIPTHRDETAMDGAPDRFLLVGKYNDNTDSIGMTNKKGSGNSKRQRQR
jgi:hypothetical protein